MWKKRARQKNWSLDTKLNCVSCGSAENLVLITSVRGKSLYGCSGCLGVIKDGALRIEPEEEPEGNVFEKGFTISKFEK